MCLSFGRGKPVSLLGGGACIVSNDSADTVASQLKLPAAAIDAKFVRAKMLAYNLLLNRFAYGLLSRLPFLGLGETALHLLQRINANDRDRLALLPANIEAYLNRQRVIEERIHRVVGKFSRLIDVPRQAADRSGRLLRYPVLCASAEQCLRLHQTLEREGLGASLMYRRALLDIPGIADKVSVPTQLVNAAVFAERLLTLPTHAGVRERDIDTVAAILHREMQR
jgi:hypothetical protein